MIRPAFEHNFKKQNLVQEQSLFSPPRTTCCQGVDLNRNFDWFFGQVGSSTDPCSEIYQGAYAFSEPETASVRDFLARHKVHTFLTFHSYSQILMYPFGHQVRTYSNDHNDLGAYAFSEPETASVRDFLARHKVHTFLTFHSYSQILMYPFGHQVRTYSNDHNDLRSTALTASAHLRRMFGTTYKVGTGADTLYPASGGSEDWAKGKAHVKYSYLFELRPEEQVWDGFLLAENQVISALSCGFVDKK
ncbi:unnamed protein product [Strongylus vulgaris]|uniref:Peptidase M14 domain-containing protein n=1 Tax=Strongylus vulgaris TaxID=40348 RepID=A0A3P7J0A6_STRVU|nr:unnamed protein product [Strongylus vulgaris]